MRSYLATPLLLLTSLTFAHGQECFRRSVDQVVEQASGWFRCTGPGQSSGGASLCCIDGSECGPDSICRQSSGSFYVGGCTDANYNDPICRKDCTQYKQTFIQFQSSKHDWQCCGNSGCDEGHNGDETFKAVSPSQWEGKAGDDGLSTGADIGIGVGAGAAFVVLVGGALLWYRGNVKRSRKSHMGVRGRYEEIGGLRGRAPSPQPQPYGRSTSPVPPVRGMEAQRERSRSIGMDERVPFPAPPEPSKRDSLAAV